MAQRLHYPYFYRVKNHSLQIKWLLRIIEEGTREQHTNPNWKSARNGLLASSNFKTICHSTNMNNTANNLLKESTIHEEHIPPSKMKQKLE
jgi:hypothetical protein